MSVDSRSTPRASEVPRGLDAAWHAAGGLVARLRYRAATSLRFAANVGEFEGWSASMSEAAMEGHLDALREVFARGRESAEDLARAFALIREVADRRLGQRPFLVQIAAAHALHRGCIVEFATGEGKTLAATLPAVVAGWRRRGCHVVTVNDYLARRDAEWMAPVYSACGVRVAWIAQETPPDARREAYAAGVTYATNKEVAADFLRDGLARRQAASMGRGGRDGRSGANGPALVPVQRGLEHAIVDEADSILIDEAVTPLIISGGAEQADAEAARRTAAALAADLADPGDFSVDERFREVRWTARGRERVRDAARSMGGLWVGARRREELVGQALSARTLFHRDQHYVVRDDRVVIVDEFTGRVMPDRQWRDGLHQAVEAKESVAITPMRETLARVSFQRFFRLYRRLAGMTGTAREERGELWRVYSKPVVAIPSHRPCRRAHLPQRTLRTPEEKWTAVVEEIARVHAEGRPVLVGTRTVEASEHLSRLLGERGLACEVLNATRHEEEARIVADAGLAGRVTVATNMAGRGTDIRLGSGVAERGGLHVIATERHESSRVDRQLFGRAARQGDPGSACSIVCFEDDVLARFVPSWARRLLVGPSWLPRITGRACFALAQARAQSMARQRRGTVLRQDTWIDESLAFGEG